MHAHPPNPPQPAGTGLRYEVARTLLLAGPLVIGQLTSFGMNFVDTVMAGRLGAIDLGAIAIGSSVWAAGLLFALGVLMSVSPAVSQLDGAGRRRMAGELARQAIWIALGLSVLLALGARNAGWVMDVLDVQPDVAALALGYLKAMSWGAPAMTVMLVLKFFAEGAGHTRPTMYIGLLGIACNVPLNYVLMFGKLGMPELGAVGCGWATAIVFWLQALVLALYIRHRTLFRDFRLFSHFGRPSRREIGALLRVGLPIGVMIFFEGSLFVSAALLIGTLGALPIAAHQVAINFASMAFMVPLGLAGAITVRVGNAIGRGEPRAARRAGLVGIGIAVPYALCSATVMTLFPDWIARIYTADREVIDLAARLIVLAAVLQVSDGMQVAAAGALRGLKDTRVPMLYSVLSYWAVGLALGAWLTFGREWGAPGMWTGMIAGLTVAAVLLCSRFWRTSKRVIEGSWQPDDRRTPEIADP
ncbi:MAG: MATE family efflux transporter [Wenzhouxiangellaceae bacterium]|nr:MATE family efflux transporter [Wenzhouxiangellaceae bacterium]